MANLDHDIPVTKWIAGLKAGQSAAAEGLWEHYFARLVALARSRLSTSSRRLADEEDVALSAFKSLCLGAADGRFPQLRDRDNLWPLLVVLTVRKARDLVKHEQRQKRGGSRSRTGRLSHEQTEWESIVGTEPTPEFATMVAENCENLLGLLDAAQRQIALLKLEGYSNAEVAGRLQCGVRTVERRLELTRRIWKASGNGAANGAGGED